MRLLGRPVLRAGGDSPAQGKLRRRACVNALGGCALQRPRSGTDRFRRRSLAAFFRIAALGRSGERSGATPIQRDSSSEQTACPSNWEGVGSGEPPHSNPNPPPDRTHPKNRSALGVTPVGTKAALAPVRRSRISERRQSVGGHVSERCRRRRGDFRCAAGQTTVEYLLVCAIAIPLIAAVVNAFEIIVPSSLDGASRTVSLPYP